MRAWSLYTRSEGTSYAGHEGYDDRLGSHYSYDSAVPNHLRVSVGDVVVLRDDSGSLGVAFVERIDERAGRKTRHRCPTCSTSQLEQRRTATPLFRCKRGHTFDAPVDVEEDVTIYRAEYSRSFARVQLLDPQQLETLCLARSKQNAIRELDLDRTLSALRARDIWPSFTSAD